MFLKNLQNIDRFLLIITGSQRSYFIFLCLGQIFIFIADILFIFIRTYLLFYAAFRYFHTSTLSLVVL